MSGFLVDTNVISEPARSKPNPGVVAWLAKAEEESIFLSVLTLGEVRSGIERVVDSARRTSLERFFFRLRDRFGSRILPIDAAVAERWGRMIGGLASSGESIPAIDSLIAATALHHDLTVVTHNTGDFARAGIPVIDPFAVGHKP